MDVKIVKWEKFSPEEIEKKGFPKDPTIVSKSNAMPCLEAVRQVNSYVENSLQKGFKLKRGPEKKLSLYQEESTSITDYHYWYTLEKVEEESN